MEEADYSFSRSESLASYFVSIHSSKAASFFIFSREAAVFFNWLDRAGTCDAAARTGHSLQKIAIVFAGFCNLEHFFAVGKAVRAYDFDVAVWLKAVDCLYD